MWHERDTTPAAIADALSDLLKERQTKGEGHVPARVLNLVVIADRDWRGEIHNRLERVGRYHPSRTILCAVERGRSALDAIATIRGTGDPRPGELALCHEEVVVEIGEHHLSKMDTIVDPLVVSDLATVVWSPHGYPEAVDSLQRLAQVVLIDSEGEPDPAAAAARARELGEQSYVVDLAWLRSTPWRERVAATFDPEQWRGELGRISAVTVRHRPESVITGVLFFGWLASRLGWEPGEIIPQNGSLFGRAHGRRQDVELRLEPDPTMSAPGLAGVTIDTAAGVEVALNRGPGGLTAHRRLRDGRDWSWTVLGASRGEAGILGEGIRQALLRDPTYAPALAAAGTMLP
ncbi:MAG TPA: glucose-6-phosphate dehydrogenase assembly protein OpcA [Thermoleophilaceae bacterium]|nr:glucose-6-phosphate dehydrogenase assembly protein OpcA [Thermoleophilaceae bacterium]